MSAVTARMTTDDAARTNDEIAINRVVRAARRASSEAPG